MGENTMEKHGEEEQNTKNISLAEVLISQLFSSESTCLKRDILFRHATQTVGTTNSRRKPRNRPVPG